MAYSEASDPLHRFSFSVVSLSVFEPAGRNSVAPADMMRIRPADCDSPEALVQAIGIPKQKDGLSMKLLFYCRGGLYFLAQVLVVSAVDESTPLPPRASGSLPNPAL